MGLQMSWSWSWNTTYIVEPKYQPPHKYSNKRGQDRHRSADRRSDFLVKYWVSNDIGLREKKITLDLILKVHQGTPARRWWEQILARRTKFGRQKLSRGAICSREIELGMLENVIMGTRHQGIHLNELWPGTTECFWQKSRPARTGAMGSVGIFWSLIQPFPSMEISILNS